MYNFGGRCEKPNLELTHTAARPARQAGTLIRYVQDRPGHDRRYAIDCTKAERELGLGAAGAVRARAARDDRLVPGERAWVAAIQNKDYLSYYEKQYGKL